MLSVFRQSGETATSPPKEAALSFSTDVPIGSELLGFRIEKEIGRGGMGVVYLAEDTRLRRKVALKLLAPGLAQDGAFRERFLAESELAASLDHPNIVPIYEAGEADGRIFIAMRYVEGADLKALLCQGPLDPAHTVAIVAQIASALDAAHARGLVHRDVKPSNVLLAESLAAGRPEHVYLADFGLTRRLSEPELLTQEPQLAGTIDYIAPEQIRGDAVDGRADLYSLGCLLYECLTGRPPYRHEQDLALLFAHLEQPPPTLTAEKHDLPNEIDGVIATALAKDPDDRYQTGDELAAAARDALGLGSPARRWWASPAILAAVAGVALVAIAVAGYVATQGTPSAAALPGADALVRIDPKTNTVTKRFDVGREASDVAVGGGYVWVTNFSDSTVSRLDPESGEMQTIAVPGKPVGRRGRPAVGRGRHRAGAGKRERGIPRCGHRCDQQHRDPAGRSVDDTGRGERRPRPVARRRRAAPGHARSCPRGGRRRRRPSRPGDPDPEGRNEPVEGIRDLRRHGRVRRWGVDRR